ncbi:MAG: preprotein translocase subunit SecG [Pyrinomonadaceae bacterium]
MLYVLYGIFFLSCVVLIAVVLLQPGKTDAGALFTSNISSTAFAPRGTASVLQKATIGAAIFFMLSALLISMPALTGNVSVLQSGTDSPLEETMTEPAPAAAESSDANASSTPADANSNGALIETPATNRVERQAANAAAAPASNQ